MVKPDEVAFMIELNERSKRSERGFVYVRALAQELGIPPKRAAAICHKWSGRRHWYDWGVNVLAGWLTDKGKAEAERLAALQRATVTPSEPSDDEPGTPVPSRAR